MRRTTNAYSGVRDFQRSKVYRAESFSEYSQEAVLHFIEHRFYVKGNPLGKSKLAERIESVKDIQKWIDSITDSDWFRSYLIPANEEELSDHITPRHRHYRIQVKDGRGRRRAGGSSAGYITLPVWSRTRITILHEVAHVIIRTKPWHGKAFTRCVLDLVHEFVGPEWAEHLRLCYDDKKVKYLDCGYQEELEVRCFPLEGEERKRVEAQLRIPVDRRKNETNEVAVKPVWR